MRLVTLEYEQALKLEKLGFFKWRHLLFNVLIANSPEAERRHLMKSFIYPGPPTIVEALKWCRDEHNLHVSMTFVNDECLPKVFSIVDGQYRIVNVGRLQASVAYEWAELLTLNWCIDYILEKTNNAASTSLPPQET